MPWLEESFKQGTGTLNDKDFNRSFKHKEGISGKHKEGISGN